MQKLLQTCSKYKFTLLTAFFLNSFVSFSAVVTGNMTPMTFSSGSVNQAIYDLDNNGQFDFKVNLVYLGSSNYMLVFNGLDGAKFETDGGLELIGYNDGTPLGGNTYRDSGYVKSLYFPEGTLKYVGLTFKINGVSHCAYVGARASSYYQGVFDLWTFGYETDSGICINANSTSSSAGSEDLNTTDSKVTIYPNPASDEVFLSSPGKSLVSVSNLEGKEISVFEFYDEQTLDVSNFEAGIYFISIQRAATEERKTIRFVKE